MVEDPQPPPDAPADKPAPAETAPAESTPVEGAPVETGPAATSGSALSPVNPAVPDTGYTQAGVPTFEGVREKIENRYGTALGATELAEETRAGRTAAQQFEARQRAAEEKLEEIRASMHKPDQG